ncbi:MAG: hypothetical protein M3O61_13485 [Gemmatimonadota bacterium]|nr:hypothetical protein [Gemmatimonadota bacterium]
MQNRIVSITVALTLGVAHLAKTPARVDSLKERAGRSRSTGLVPRAAR